MRPVSGRALWIILVCSLLVLITTGIAVDTMTTRYASSEYWVSHTHEMETQLVSLRADLLSAEASRLAYVVSEDEAELPAYDEAMRAVPNEFDLLQHLTADNPSQQQRLSELRPLIEQRLGVLQESVSLVKNGVADRDQQRKFTETGASLMHSIRAILDNADAAERSLLLQREYLSEKTYSWARNVLIASFFSTTIILIVAFARLVNELRNREQAEEAIRTLSGRLLKVQDEERRRIARELHDSLGQLLSSVKMNLDQLAGPPTVRSAAETQELITTSAALIQESVAETRTLSYLLHPPLLDEFGLGSATKWYIEGFSSRSKIDVKIEIDPHFGRLPEEIELALFRVLQESLTNIHRHSGSASAQVRAIKSADSVTLTIIDYGKGMSPKTLEKFETTQGGLGVGLAGMRERVHQFGGTMKIRSNARGTVVEVHIPLRNNRPAEVNSPRSAEETPERENPQEQKPEQQRSATPAL